MRRTEFNFKTNGNGNGKFSAERILPRIITIHDAVLEKEMDVF